MNPVAIVKVVTAVASVAVSIEEKPEYKRVKLFGVIPVYDTRWEGVKRRQARRAARRAAREAEMQTDAKRMADKYTGGRK